MHDLSNLISLAMACVHGSSVAQLCLTLSTPRAVACHTTQSMEFSREEYWSGLQYWNGLPFLQGTFPIQGSNLRLLHCQEDSLLFEPQGKLEN